MHSFGDIRSLLSEPPSERVWEALWPLLGFNVFYERPDIREYCNTVLSRDTWQGITRCIPLRWHLRMNNGEVIFSTEICNEITINLNNHTSSFYLNSLTDTPFDMLKKVVIEGKSSEDNKLNFQLVINSLIKNPSLKINELALRNLNIDIPALHKFLLAQTRLSQLSIYSEDPCSLIYWIFETNYVQRMTHINFDVFSMSDRDMNDWINSGKLNHLSQVGWGLSEYKNHLSKAYEVERYCYDENALESLTYIHNQRIAVVEKMSSSELLSKPVKSCWKNLLNFETEAYKASKNELVSLMHTEQPDSSYSG